MTHTEREPEQTGGVPGGAVANTTADIAARQRTTPQSRVEGLAVPAIRHLQIAAQSFDRADLDTATKALADAQAITPDHPEILRLLGVLAYRRGRLADAGALLRRTLAAWPDDAAALGNLGSVYADSGRVPEALSTFRRACAVAPESASTWFNLGRVLDSQAHLDEAEQVFHTALERAPEHINARIAHASTLTALGRTDDAAVEYRQAIARNPRAIQAWLGLVNLKTVRLDANETAALERLRAEPALSEKDRSVVGFALGKVLEDNGRYADAFTMLAAANAARRRMAPWNATLFSQRVDAVAAAFAAPAVTQASDPSLGAPVIFVVSLPRSGSTLVEQILASHAEVEGASELPDLEAVILEESVLRNRQFPDWIADASAEDWQRMGERYLKRTARWRERRPYFTDKMPDNWLLVGAALAMLPGAHVINVRRDPIETCWSCFKQLFAVGAHLYSYDLADLAETWHDYDRLSRQWRERFPDRVREQSYEALLAEPEAQTRALLDFCGLPFDPACLSPHETARSVRTASAAQVREPLRSGTARSQGYAEMLEPLRRMLSTENPPAMPALPATRERHAASVAQRSERTQGLDETQARDLIRAAALLASDRADQAAPIIDRIRAVHADHPEVLRVFGALESARGRHAEAVTVLNRAALAKPDDALIRNTLGTAQIAAGDENGALASFTRAAEIDPLDPNAQHNLGNLLVARGDFERAASAFERAVAIEPGFVPARIALANALRQLDRDDDAAPHLREALARDRQSAAAWQELSELRAAEFSASDRGALEQEYQRARRADSERASLGYALGNLLDSRAQYAEAFASIVAANALRRRAFSWDSARHSNRCDVLLETFDETPSPASTSSLGAGYIFILAMPDQFATAIARALRAHDAVDSSGGGNPARVISHESARRGQKLPQWARSATATEWERLGRIYIEQNPLRGSHSHRVIDARSFDAELAGAVAMMLPAARFVQVDVDALESCWSCFRTDFHDGQRYSCDFAELASYWRDQQRVLQRWNVRFGERIVGVHADALGTDGAGELARLFAHCGLETSAVQEIASRLRLRERAPARAYGDLLKPLANMLAASPDTDGTEKR